jgi:hypothetical protein
MQKRGIVHVFLCIGVERFHLDQASIWIVTLLHFAVTLFMIGLIVFLFPINPVVAGVSLGSLALAGVSYIALSALPTFFPDCPYQTPLTPLIATFRLLFSILFTLLCRISELCPNFLTCLIYFIPRVIISLSCYFVSISKTVFLAVLSSLRTYLRTRYPAYAQRYIVLDNVQQSVALVKFALDRVMSRVDEIHEVEAFLESFPPLLESLKGTPSFHREAYIGTLISHVRYKMQLFLQINILLHSILYSPNGIPRNVQIRRASIVFSAVRYLLECFSRTTPYGASETGQDFYSSNDCTELFHRWASLRTSGPTAVAFLATIHVAAFRTSLLLEPRVRSQPETEITSAPSGILFRRADIVQRLLPVHDGPCCGKDGFESSEPDTMAHTSHRTLLTCLFDILSAPPDVVHAHSGLWLPLLDKQTNHLRILRLPPQKQSKAFTGLFIEAGLEGWLEPNSSFKSEPKDRPSSPLLERYPQLKNAFKKLARTVTSSQLSAPVVNTPLAGDGAQVEADSRSASAPCAPSPTLSNNLRVYSRTTQHVEEHRIIDVYPALSIAHIDRPSLEGQVCVDHEATTTAEAKKFSERDGDEAESSAPHS